MNEEKKDGKFAALAFFIIVCFISVGIALGWNLSSMVWKRVAVEQEHAEWYIEDHHQEWRWKPVPGGTKTK